MNLNPNLFAYDRHADLQIRDIYQVPKDGVLIHNFTFLTPFGYRRAAYCVRPEAPGPCAGILYVHWYEPASPTSNRSQFVAEARQLAKAGAVCLLVETLWSDDDWFYKRSQAEDQDYSIKQVIELRIALDLLLAQPGVDLRRIAYVGHDFGAMYGILMASMDLRPTCYALMAATARFSDWFLYYPELDGQARQDYIESMNPFDPLTHIGRLAPAPVLLQFAKNDFHVPVERAQALFEAAGEPKTLAWYEAEHGLNEQATEDRIKWLRQQLQLGV